MFWIGKRDSNNSWSRWIVLSVVVLFGQSVWLYALSAPSWPQGMQNPAPIATWTWIAADLVKPDAHVSNVPSYRSPSLIALPNMDGFSRTLLMESVSVEPPLEPPPDLSLRLKKPVQRQDSGTAIKQLSRIYAAPGIARETVLHARDRKGEPPYDPKRSLHMTWRIRSVRALESIPPAEEGLLNAPPWHAEVSLYVDANGLVRQAFLERRTSSDKLDSVLLRMVHTWRWETGTSPETLRVRLSNVAPAPSLFSENNNESRTY